jgi:demethylmenaquinone methyltransferase / 2-methoxy-6-polyprenyl-1,4-benzoquinol methylase
MTISTEEQAARTAQPGASRAASGSRPEGASDARDASARVQQMFSHIAPRYDFLNHLLSFGLDTVWRRSTAGRFRKILERTNAQVLDICCGTGDLAFALERVRAFAERKCGKAGPPVVASDFVEPMLVRAREKAKGANAKVTFAAADALRLPFVDASFDLLTTAFGFRNLASYEDGLREMARVLKPGGAVGILEFSEPTTGVMSGIFRFYFRHVLPKVGGAVSGNSEAYAYLPNSVAKFPSSSELAALMEKCGFADVTVASWNFGSVLLHSARKI